MKLLVSRSFLKGTAAIPGSKSHTIRAVAIASLATGKSIIRNPLVSSDTLSSVACYRALGANIDTSDDNAWIVTGTPEITAPEKVIDIGNSGTTLRIAMSTAALSGSDRAIEITGDNQIQKRPVAPLIDSLNQLGAEARSVKDNGCAPVQIKGGYKGGKTTLECVTSQYLTSLLLAAPIAPGDTEIEVTLLNEPDYVRMTLDWLDKQDIEYTNENFRYFRIPGGQTYKPFDLPVPSDFSSATFFLCAGAFLDADITLTGLDFSDSQPDKAVADYLKEMGADITIKEDCVNIKGTKLHGIDIDMNKTPDALPAMAITAAFADSPTKFYNVAQARKKETDRITCMAEELAKLNIKTEEMPDGLIVYPSGDIKPAPLDGRHDHRIVMANALAGMALEGETVIDTAEAMNVTFPTFVELMTSLGANMRLEE